MKKVNMSIHQFMEMERGNISLKEISNSNKVPSNTSLKVYIASTTTIIALTLLYLICYSYDPIATTPAFDLANIFIQPF